MLVACVLLVMGDDEMNHETEAVRCWRKHEGNKREFAEHAALSGLPAAHIAQKIRDAGGGLL